MMDRETIVRLKRGKHDVWRFSGLGTYSNRYNPEPNLKATLAKAHGVLTIVPRNTKQFFEDKHKPKQSSDIV